MSGKILLTLIWVGFVGYAFTLAPPNQPDTFELIKNLSTANVAGINPLIVALFNIMGFLPLAYACITFLDGRSQKIPAWLFTAASFGVGAFSLLPYLIFRKSNPTFTGQKNWFLKLMDSRITGGAIALGAIGLFLYGVTNGDWSNFVQQWQTDRFIHVMSLDFCLLCGLFPVLLQDDIKRRGLENSQAFRILSFLPFFGALMYLVLRPPTIEPSTSVSPEKAPA
ncbi:DUF2834 domain-containing protein [Leptolyngbya sp. FACHB-17]|uniref:DUF2834 domain-containing protein n=1 Tax=unclassified Leptolyngbya TaxID=2650499 RepID=UPI0016809CC1|nr:DUF2834 domain-containing protein [Leptolyngbya sp. FACHB-17]MBD2078586.1 DUF2834 domain-containing protein [Leptolyngbya sp. FACHB-17]